MTTSKGFGISQIGEIVTSKSVTSNNFFGTNGNATSPSYAFVSNTNMGMYRANTTALAWTVNGTKRMSINNSGNFIVTGDIDSLSDERLKKEIVVIDSALNKIDHIRGVSFYWNEQSSFLDKTNDKDYGVIAQEIESVFPEMVHEESGYKTVSYDKLIPVLIQCIKELKEDLNNIKQRIENASSTSSG
jgi:hypothetical protein